MQGGEDLCKTGLSKMFSKRRKSESQVHPKINFEEVREDDGRQLAAYLDQGLLQVIGLQPLEVDLLPQLPTYKAVYIMPLHNYT